MPTNGTIDPQRRGSQASPPALAHPQRRPFVQRSVRDARDPVLDGPLPRAPRRAPRAPHRAPLAVSPRPLRRRARPARRARRLAPRGPQPPARQRRSATQETLSATPKRYSRAAPRGRETRPQDPIPTLAGTPNSGSDGTRTRGLRRERPRRRSRRMTTDDDESPATAQVSGGSERSFR